MTTAEQIIFTSIVNEKFNCLLLTEQIEPSGEYDGFDLFNALNRFRDENRRMLTTAGTMHLFDAVILDVYGNLLKNIDAGSIAYMLEDIKTRNKLFKDKYKQSLHEYDLYNEYK